MCVFFVLLRLQNLQAKINIIFVVTALVFAIGEKETKQLPVSYHTALKLYDMTQVVTQAGYQIRLFPIFWFLWHFTVCLWEVIQLMVCLRPAVLGFLKSVPNLLVSLLVLAFSQAGFLKRTLLCTLGLLTMTWCPIKTLILSQFLSLAALWRCIRPLCEAVLQH